MDQGMWPGYNPHHPQQQAGGPQNNHPQMSGGSYNLTQHGQPQYHGTNIHMAPHVPHNQGQQAPSQAAQTAAYTRAYSMPTDTTSHVHSAQPYASHAYRPPTQGRSQHATAAAAAAVHHVGQQHYQSAQHQQQQQQQQQYQAEVKSEPLDQYQQIYQDSPPPPRMPYSSSHGHYPQHLDNESLDYDLSDFCDDYLNQEIKQEQMPIKEEQFAFDDEGLPLHEEPMFSPIKEEPYFMSSNQLMPTMKNPNVQTAMYNSELYDPTGGAPHGATSPFAPMGAKLPPSMHAQSQAARSYQMQQAHYQAQYGMGDYSGYGSQSGSPGQAVQAVADSTTKPKRPRKKKKADDKKETQMDGAMHHYGMMNAILVGTPSSHDPTGLTELDESIDDLAFPEIGNSNNFGLNANAMAEHPPPQPIAPPKKKRAPRKKAPSAAATIGSLAPTGPQQLFGSNISGVGASQNPSINMTSRNMVLPNMAGEPQRLYSPQCHDQAALMQNSHMYSHGHHANMQSSQNALMHSQNHSAHLQNMQNRNAQNQGGHMIQGRNAQFQPGQTPAQHNPMMQRVHNAQLPMGLNPNAAKMSGQSVGQPLNQNIGPGLGQNMSPFLGQNMGHSNTHSIVRPMGQNTGQSMGQNMEQSSGQMVGSAHFQQGSNFQPSQSGSMQPTHLQRGPRIPIPTHVQGRPGQGLNPRMMQPQPPRIVQLQHNTAQQAQITLAQQTRLKGQQEQAEKNRLAKQKARIAQLQLEQLNQDVKQEISEDMIKQETNSADDEVFDESKIKEEPCIKKEPSEENDSVGTELEKEPPRKEEAFAEDNAFTKQEPTIKEEPFDYFEESSPQIKEEPLDDYDLPMDQNTARKAPAQSAMHTSINAPTHGHNTSMAQVQNHSQSVAVHAQTRPMLNQPMQPGQIRPRLPVQQSQRMPIMSPQKPGQNYQVSGIPQQLVNQRQIGPGQQVRGQTPQPGATPRQAVPQQGSIPRSTSLQMPGQNSTMQQNFNRPQFVGQAGQRQQYPQQMGQRVPFQKTQRPAFTGQQGQRNVSPGFTAAHTNTVTSPSFTNIPTQGQSSASTQQGRGPRVASPGFAGQQSPRVTSPQKVGTSPRPAFSPLGQAMAQSPRVRSPGFSNTTALQQPQPTIAMQPRMPRPNFAGQPVRQPTPVNYGQYSPGMGVRAGAPGQGPRPRAPRGAGRGRGAGPRAQGPFSLRGQRPMTQGLAMSAAVPNALPQHNSFPSPTGQQKFHGQRFPNPGFPQQGISPKMVALTPEEDDDFKHLEAAETDAKAANARSSLSAPKSGPDPFQSEFVSFLKGDKTETLSNMIKGSRCHPEPAMTCDDESPPVPSTSAGPEINKNDSASTSPASDGNAIEGADETRKNTSKRASKSKTARDKGPKTPKPRKPKLKKEPIGKRLVKESRSALADATMDPGIDPLTDQLPQRVTSTRKAKENLTLQSTFKRKTPYVDSSSSAEDHDYDSDKDPVWMPFVDQFAGGKGAGSDSDGGRKRRRDPTKVPRPRKKRNSAPGRRPSKGKMEFTYVDADGVSHICQIGDFIVQTSKLSQDNFSIWKLDSGSLIQKFEAVDCDGQMCHQVTTTYSKWTSDNKDDYQGIQVTVLAEDEEGPTMVQMITGDDSGELESDFFVVMQTLLSQALEPGFIETVIDEEVHYYLDPLDKFDQMIMEKKTSVLNNVQWADAFIECVERRPYMNIVERPDSSTCQARTDQREIAVKCVEFYGQMYDPISMETVEAGPELPHSDDFMIGPTTADVITTFHKLEHFKYLTFKRCSAKIDLIREEDESLPTKDILDRCLSNRTWVLKILDEFKKL